MNEEGTDMVDAVAPHPASPLLPAGTTIMAIINRTRDSFYDQGATWELSAAVQRGIEAASQGAGILDVGGVPFAPGEAIPATEESRRVVPVIAALRESLPDILLSVDTFHASVAREAIAAGADIINDTTALSDPEMPGTVAEQGAGIVLTHSLAGPRRPHPSPQYADVMTEVLSTLRRLVATARHAGIAEGRIIVDPGPDLNKSTVHTLELLRRWEELGALGLPVLAALSRKDVIGESLGLPKQDRLEGSLAAAAWVHRAGARVLRVHDVAQTVRLVRMLEVISGDRDPAGPLIHNV